MKVTHRSFDLLVLSTNRRLIALANIVAAPFISWLGLAILEDGGTEWFGWCFVALGPIMAVLGVAGLFIRLSLTFDKTNDVVRFRIKGPFRRRNRTMPLSSVARVELRFLSMNRSELAQLVIAPHAGSSAQELTVTEFWTHAAARDAESEVRNWLAQQSSPD